MSSYDNAKGTKQIDATAGASQESPRRKIGRVVGAHLVVAAGLRAGKVIHVGGAGGGEGEA